MFFIQVKRIRTDTDVEEETVFRPLELREKGPHRRAAQEGRQLRVRRAASLLRLTDIIISFATRYIYS